MTKHEVQILPVVAEGMFEGKGKDFFEKQSGDKEGVSWLKFDGLRFELTNGARIYLTLNEVDVGMIEIGVNLSAGSTLEVITSGVMKGRWRTHINPPGVFS